MATTKAAGSVLGGFLRFGTHPVTGSEEEAMSKTPAEMTDDELEAAENAARGEDGGTSTETTTETTEGTQAGEGAGETTTTEGGETTSTTGTEQTDQAGTGTQTTTTTEQAAAETTAGAETGKVAGVASKDGTRVLPYSALQAERRSARQAAARAERAERELETAKKQIEDLRAGKSTESGELTEEEVQRMEADFPEVGKKMRALLERNQELAKKAATAGSTEGESGDEDDVATTTQEAIDQVPLLSEWQYSEEHQDKWQRAVAIDNLLRESPKWKGKPAVERFERVASMVAEEFDIEVPQPKPGKADTTSAPKQTQPKQTTDPKKAVESAQRQPPSTLSDLKGGSVPDHGQADLNRMPAPRMLNRFLEMSDADIDRELERLG